eukprot:11692679-Ditylum_brightwellii.AAC.1
MASINWDAFRIARKHQSQHSKQIVKLFHGILPTNKMIYRKDTQSPDIMQNHRTPKIKNRSAV